MSFLKFSRFVGYCIPLFLSCGLFSNSDDEIVSINSQSSPCGGFAALAKKNAGQAALEKSIPCLEETLFWQYDPTVKMLTLVHCCVQDNCAANLSMYVVRKENKLIVCQSDKRNPAAGAACDCTFDLFCEVPDIPGPFINLALDTFSIALNLNDQKGKIILHPLEFLMLEDGQFADLSFLSAYPRLQSLHQVNASAYPDLSPIGRLPGLTSLYCCNADSIGFLAPCAKLEHLEIRATRKLSDISALRSLNNLASLGIYGASSVSDISPIGNCQKLIFLSLTDCIGVSTMSSLHSCSSLTSLTLSRFHAITDISALAGLMKLQTLRLSRMPGVTTIRPLAGLTDITALSIDYLTSIPSLEPLGLLNKLEQLSISDNRLITDISPLSKLTKLKYLRLMNMTSIRDFSPLLSCLGSGDSFIFPGTAVPQDIVDLLRKKGVACKGGKNK